MDFVPQDPTQYVDKINKLWGLGNAAATFYNFEGNYNYIPGGPKKNICSSL